MFFADINGSGTKDIIYICQNSIKLFINQNGNSFTDPITVSLPEAYSDSDQISFMDIYGNGTTCIVFTKMAVTPKHYYYDFVGKVNVVDNKSLKMKPYLLYEIDNNLGFSLAVNISL